MNTRLFASFFAATASFVTLTCPMSAHAEGAERSRAHDAAPSSAQAAPSASSSAQAAPSAQSAAQSGALPLVTVVEIAASAAELGADRLRALIGAELGGIVVSAGDARAAQAQGTVTVELDRGRGELVVSYLAHDAPLRRRVPLPATTEAAQRAAVLLAGNLARNEASDLVRELRGEHAPVPAATAGAPPPKNQAKPHTLDDPPNTDGRGARKARDAARLQATLDDLAKSGHASRVATGWSLVAAGALTMGASAYMGADSRQNGWYAVSLNGVAFAAIGVGALLEGGPYDHLSDYARHAAAYPEATEQEWLRSAKRERRVRNVAGVTLLVTSAATLAAGTVTLFGKDSSMTTNERYDWSLTFLALSTLTGVVGAYELASEGSVERDLHTYERSSGRVVDPAHASGPKFQLGATPLGFMAGVSGTF